MTHADQYGPPPILGAGALGSLSTEKPLSPNASAGQQTATELVTCPECGLMAKVEVTKRNSVDFCRNCDFPLFWARATIVSSFGEETGASLRRLPGTAGRAQRASVPCPHCGEPNTPTASHCIRCTLPMVIVAPPPPAPAPPPAPVVVEPEPEPARNWWWLVIICLCLLAMTIIIAVVTLT